MISAYIYHKLNTVMNLVGIFSCQYFHDIRINFVFISSLLENLNKKSHATHGVTVIFLLKLYVQKKKENKNKLKPKLNIFLKN